MTDIHGKRIEPATKTYVKCKLGGRNATLICIKTFSHNFILQPGVVSLMVKCSNMNKRCLITNTKT